METSRIHEPYGCEKWLQQQRGGSAGLREKRARGLAEYLAHHFKKSVSPEERKEMGMEIELAQKIADAVVEGIALVHDEHIIERKVFGDLVALDSEEWRTIDAAVEAATRAAWQAAAVAAALAQEPGKSGRAAAVR
jgi:hypothetical protein